MLEIARGKVSNRRFQEALPSLGVGFGMNADPEQLARTSRQLLLVGGLLSIILTPGLLLLQTPVADIELRDLMGTAINFILAIILFVAAWQMKRNAMTATLLAFVASIALLGLGGTAGLIAGLFGIVGAVAGAAPIAWSFLKEEG